MAAAREICGCATEESRHQGVTAQAMKSEMAQIQKDPSYQIEDPALLASFQYCALISMEKADKAHRDQAKKGPPGTPADGG